MSKGKAKDVEEAYEKLRVAGENTVDNLVQWMKDAQILQMVEKTEKEAVAMFRDVKEQEKVSKKEFDQVLTSIVEKSKHDMHKINDMLASEVPKVINAMEAAAKAFEEALAPPPPPPPKSNCVIF